MNKQIGSTNRVCKKHFIVLSPVQFTFLYPRQGTNSLSRDRNPTEMSPQTLVRIYEILQLDPFSPPPLL